ncbi:MAG: hypothetical protein FWB78_02275, partial [Treponema sp.]|nr:hypothetical protein [Treponema sp.]
QMYDIYLLPLPVDRFELLRSYRFAPAIHRDPEFPAAEGLTEIGELTDLAFYFRQAVLDGEQHRSQQRRSDQRLGIRGMNERAALLGGKLTVNGQGGKGTTVSLHIPHAALTPATADVLLIDDHPVMNLAFASYFEKARSHPATLQVSTLGEAKRFIEKTPRLPSIVILDIQLGRENGLDFLPFLGGFCRERRVPKPPRAGLLGLRQQASQRPRLRWEPPVSSPKTRLLANCETPWKPRSLARPTSPGNTPTGCTVLTANCWCLSAKELEAFNLAQRNMTNEQIAQISKRTMDKHMENIHSKTGTSSRAELMGL